MNIMDFIYFLFLVIILIIILVVIVIAIKNGFKILVQRFYCTNCKKINTLRKIKEVERKLIVNRTIEEVKREPSKESRYSFGKNDILDKYYKCTNCGNTITFTKFPDNGTML